MMKVDSAASSFKLITFLIMHIMTKLNYFIFHHFIYFSFVRMSSYNRFSYLGSGFCTLAYRPPPPKEPTRHFHILCNTWQYIHAKAFFGSQGGTIHYKRFSYLLYISYKKIDCFNPQFRSCGMENKFYYPIVQNSGKLTCA